GFFPILWIVINAIWVYNLTVASGHFDVLRRSFEKVSPDQRVHAVIIAFCFGALLEALAGFGTPVAITVVVLMPLGFQPLNAAVVCGIAFAVAQFVASNYVSVPLTDIIASLVSAGAVVLLLRAWSPAEVLTAEPVLTREPDAVAAGSRPRPGAAGSPGHVDTVA